MKKKTITGEPNRTIELSEITDQELDQVTGAADATSDSPIYMGGGGGAENPLFERSSAATNPLYTPL